MSRGLQNCNPGNIRQSKVRYKGEVRPSRDPAFKQFESLAWGYRAIFVLLDTYRIRYGLDTIRGMISRWAPPSENHTETYIRAVADAVEFRTGNRSTPATARRCCAWQPLFHALKRRRGRYGRGGTGVGTVRPRQARIRLTRPAGDERKR